MATNKPGWTEVANLTGVLPMTKPGEPIALSNADEVANSLMAVWDACRVKPDDVPQGSAGGLEISLKQAWELYLCRRKSELSDFPLTDDKGSRLSIIYRFPVLHSVVNALCAQEMSPIYASDPLFQAKPVDAKDEDFAQESERAMAYLVNDVVQYDKARRKTLERAHIERVGVMHIPYRQTKRWVWDAEGNGTNETVYDAPSCEVVPRDRFSMWPDGSDPDLAVYVQIRSDMAASELLADHERPESERLYTLTDEQWERALSGHALGTPAADREQDKSRLQDGGPYERVDTYVRLPMQAGGEVVDVLCLLTVLREINTVIRATPCKVSRHVPVVLYYPYDHGDALDGKSTVDLVDASSLMLHEARNAQTSIAKLNELLAQTPFADVDAENARSFKLGQLNETRGGPVSFPPQIQYHDGEALAESAYYEMGRATGINDQALGQLAQTGQTATASRIALGGASLVTEQTTRLLSESDKRAVHIIAEQQYVAGPDELPYVSAATDAEEQEARQKAIEDADDARAELEQSLPEDPNGGMLPMPEPKPVSGLKRRKVVRDNFGPRVVWDVQGNTPGQDKQAKMQDFQWFLLALQTIDMMPEQDERKWELKNAAATAIRLEGTEKFIGPKPNALDALKAQPQPQGGQPAAPPQAPPMAMNGAPTADPNSMIGGAPMGGMGAGGNMDPATALAVPQPGFQQ